jgi:uncharacterized protein YdeI (YjbR/CyaY-like superfamily)
MRARPISRLCADLLVFLIVTGQPELGRTPFNDDRIVSPRRGTAGPAGRTSRPQARGLARGPLRPPQAATSRARLRLVTVVEVNPKHVRAFVSAATLEQWLAAHHESEPELWLKIFKQGSGEPTVSYREAVEVALCWGWIDGLKKSLDARAFLQRFTPRRARSIWSQINRELVERLIASGRMMPAGLAHVTAARADGRWEAAYASPRSSSVPPELLKAIEANAQALAMYQRLDRKNVYALGFRLMHLKTAAARERKIAELVALLARGEALHPLSAARSAAAPSAAPAAPKRKAAPAATRQSSPRPARARTAKKRTAR